MARKARQPPAFRQSDVTRAIKAAINAGLAIGRCEITKEGSIIITPKDAGHPSDDDLDRELAEFERRMR